MSCPDCFQGTVHEGTPTGRVAKIHGLPTYIAEPEDGSKMNGIVVIISDAFGWTLPNTRILADEMAREGNFLVYLPDFMNGHAIPTSFIDVVPKLMYSTGWKSWFCKPYYFFRLLAGFIPFFLRNRIPRTHPTIRSYFEAIRAHEAVNCPLGVAGYCWGGNHATQLAHGDVSKQGRPIVDAVFAAHPGFMKIPQDIEGVRIPYSLAVGEEDSNLSMKSVAVVKGVLAEKKREVRSEVVIYEGARHGFAIRGNPGDKRELLRGEEARAQAVRWLIEEFKRVRN